MKGVGGLQNFLKYAKVLERNKAKQILCLPQKRNKK